MRELEFVKALGQMTPTEFIAVLTTLVELWSRSAVHHASQLAQHDPSNREAIVEFMRVFHRCATVEGMLKALERSGIPIDVEQALLDTSIDELFAIVEQIKP